MNRAREPHLRMPTGPEAPSQQPSSAPTQPNPQPIYPPQYTPQPPQQPVYDAQPQWGYQQQPPQQQPYRYYPQQPQGTYQQYPVTTQHMVAQPMVPPPPSFDANLDDPEPHAPRPSSWRVLLAIAGLVGIAGISWLAYYWGPSYDGPPPVISAPEGPYKIKPESPGGAAVAYKDNLVYDRLAQHPHQVSGEQNVVILPDEPSMPTAAEPALQKPADPAQTTPLAQMNEQPIVPAAAPVIPTTTQQTPTAPAHTEPPKAEPSAQQEMNSMLAKLSDIQELPTSSQQVFFLQMATLKSESEAITEMKRLKAKLRLQQSKWHVRKNDSPNGKQYVLLLGPYKTKEEAKKRCGTIKNGCSVVAAE